MPGCALPRPAPLLVLRPSPLSLPQPCPCPPPLPRLPELSPEDKRHLLNPEQPAWARPAGLDPAQWAGIREESGRLVDGRHYKRFWLKAVPAGGRPDRLVVSGIDSAKKDRWAGWMGSGRRPAGWCLAAVGCRRRAVTSSRRLCCAAPRLPCSAGNTFILPRQVLARPGCWGGLRRCQGGACSSALLFCARRPPSSSPQEPPPATPPPPLQEDMGGFCLSNSAEVLSFLGQCLQIEGE